MAKESFTVDNLVQATDELITDSSYVLETGVSCIRGEVLKRGTTGLVKLALVGDVPYTIALQTIVGGAAPMALVYAVQGSFTAASMSTNAIGTVATFKDGLRDAGLLVF